MAVSRGGCGSGAGVERREDVVRTEPRGLDTGCTVYDTPVAQCGGRKWMVRGQVGQCSVRSD